MGVIDNFEKTYEFDGLVRVIEIDVCLKKETENMTETRTVSALVDTGAELSGIKAELAKEFGFDFARKAFVNTASGKNIPSAVYSGEIWIDDYVMYIPEIVEITNGDNPHDFVIGMNILRHSDFAVSNANGKTVFTIRFPSRNRIDFTED